MAFRNWVARPLVYGISVGSRLLLCDGYHYDGDDREGQPGFLPQAAKAGAGIHGSACRAFAGVGHRYGGLLSAYEQRGGDSFPVRVYVELYRLYGL